MESGRAKPSSAKLIPLLLLVSVIFRANIVHGNCSPSSCGSIHNIVTPFRLKSQPEKCGDSRYELSCENNLTVLYLDPLKLYVQAINYNNYTIRVVDSNVQKGNCSSIPTYSLTKDSFRYGTPYESWQQFRTKDFDSKKTLQLVKTITFLSCENPVNSPVYVDTFPCINYALSQSKSHSYVVSGGLIVSKLEDSCEIEQMTIISGEGMIGKKTSYRDIHNELAYGFELSWLRSRIRRGEKSGYCYFQDMNKVDCVHDRLRDIILSFVALTLKAGLQGIVDLDSTRLES